MANFGEKVLVMENKFRSLTIFEFHERFPDEDSCYAYLSELKWETGFVSPIADTKTIATVSVNTTGSVPVVIASLHQRAGRCFIN